MRSDRVGESLPKESCAKRTRSVLDSSPGRAPITESTDALLPTDDKIEALQVHKFTKKGDR